MTFPSLRTATTATTAILLATTATTINADGNPRPQPGGGTDVRGSYEACPEEPNLHCKNGSTCEPGIASFDKRHDHLNLQTHESGYYCKCLPGFIGHECSIQVDDCDGDTGYNPSDPTGVLQSCYHGSECKTHEESGAFYCDCKSLNEHMGPTATKFAGLMCQHESTGLCAASLVGEVASNNQFCTNHGKCVKMVMANDPHPGCVCREGWLGDHCEIQQNPTSLVQQSSEEGGSETAGKVLFSLLIIAMGSVSAGIIYLITQTRKKARMANNNNAGEKDLPGADDNISIFARPKKDTVATVMGAGDLDADGSGTLGRKNPTHVIDDDDDDVDVAEGGDYRDTDGDMELTLKVEDAAVPENDDKPEIV